MSSPVVTISEEMNEKKRVRKEIGVGSLVKANVGKMKYNTREGRIRSMRKCVVGYSKSLVGENNILVQF